MTSCSKSPNARSTRAPGPRMKKARGDEDVTRASGTQGEAPDVACIVPAPQTAIEE